MKVKTPSEDRHYHGKPRQDSKGSYRQNEGGHIDNVQGLLWIGGFEGNETRLQSSVGDFCRVFL